LLTELLLPKLRDTAASGNDVRIVALSSAAAAMCANMDVTNIPVTKDSYHEFADYTVSKACDAFHVRQLQKELKGSGISVTAVHPGLISTGLGQGNEGLTSLFYDSMLMAPVRKGLASGAATTMYCTLNEEVPKQVEQGWFFYFNRAPQRAVGVARPGRRDDLCESLKSLQMDLVKPFM
jgi:NAD(P)-dependent dehydrogenase (short-subunit alcohol dehydrogenase family)